MTRVEHWRGAWLCYLERCATRRYSAGEYDCGQFAAGGIEALTGVRLDLGAYDSLEGGLALLRARGWSTLRDAAAAALGPPVPLSRAATGDVVWFSLPRLPALLWPQEIGCLGLVDRTVALFPATQGLASIPIPLIRRRDHAAFRVGEPCPS